jgi:1-acyl-sn-glycerol-3-phosphate acyltransferase
VTEELSKMKEQVYFDDRPKEFFDRYHERSRTRQPNWIYDLVRIGASLYAWIFFRARSIGSEHVPQSGPVILAPNHFSFMDHFFAGAFTRRKVRFMAKSQLFKPPLQVVYHNGGVFPVRRGHHDEEAFRTAHTILGRGDMIVMYAEAGRSRSGELGKPRHGLGRLALEAGVPVVPTAIAGTEKARNWRRLNFPKVTVQFGEPVRFERVEDPTREQAQAASEVVFDRVRQMHGRLRSQGRAEAVRASRAARTSP